MDRLPTPTLDEFFGTEDRVVQAYKAYASRNPVDAGLTAGKAQPRDFYLYSNKATQHIGELWGRWTGVPYNSKAKRNLHKCVAKLLTDYPDVDLIETAVNTLAKAGRISPGLDMYYMRTLVTNECAKLHNQKKSYLTQDVDDTEDRSKYLRGLE